MASGVDMRVWVGGVLGNGSKVSSETRVGIALSTGDITAVGSVVGAGGAQETSIPESKNNTMIVFILFLTFQGLLYTIA